MIKDLGALKPKITYPCQWEYTIFVGLDNDVGAFLAEIFSSREYSLSKSNKNAKYQSYKLNLLVFNEIERNEIFALLKEKCAFVL